MLVLSLYPDPQSLFGQEHVHASESNEEPAGHDIGSHSQLQDVVLNHFPIGQSLIGHIQPHMV